MAANSFGRVFSITTFGETHGPQIGVVVDGCPAGLSLDEQVIDGELEKRRPGYSPYTSPRTEPDRCRIISGVFEGKTTGAPIGIMIDNCDADSSKYEPIKDLYRPGHANYTYLQKYGLFDWRGGGRASARETAARVAGGAVAKQLLKGEGIVLTGFIRELGGIRAEKFETLEGARIGCPDRQAEQKMISLLDEVVAAGDSVGAVVEVWAEGLPPTLGDPVYDKLDAQLAYAMMSINASKGVEIGSGFEGARMRGSHHNDTFQMDDGKVTFGSNHSGGTLAGISTGMPLVVRCAFKPASTIKIDQETIDFEGNKKLLTLPRGSRHDPCVGIRGVAVCEAMCALVIADRLLVNRMAKV